MHILYMICFLARGLPSWVDVGTVDVARIRQPDFVAFVGCTAANVSS